MTRKSLEESIDKLSVTALRVKSERDDFLDALHEVRELIEGYVDVNDGDYGEPEANKAMRAVQLIDDVIAKTRRPGSAAEICSECKTQKCRHGYCAQCEVCQTCAEHTRTVTV